MSNIINKKFFCSLAFKEIQYYHPEKDYAAVCEIDNKWHGKYATINFLATDEAYQNKRYGSELLKKF